MKINTLLLIIICISFMDFAQQSEKTIKVEKYINTLKKYQKDKEYSNLKYLNDKEFKSIVKEYYEATEIAPTELNKLFESDHHRWMEEVKQDRNKLNNNVKYGIVEGVVLEEIKKRYQPMIYMVSRIPIFIKAKVLSLKMENHEGFKKYVMELELEYKIKGKLPFLYQSPFKVYFRNYEGVIPEKDYKIGKSYLIPLWDRYESGNPEFAVATWVNEHGARFIVENNILYDEFNVFGMGTEVEWDKFIRDMDNTIYRITKSLEY